MQKLHFKEFANWFEKHVGDVRLNEDVSQDVCWLSRGPSFFVKSYKGYILNGVKFHTTELSKRRKTQSNGVFVSATTSTYLRNPDDPPAIRDLSYHGALENIYEICYDTLKFTIFQCKWYDGSNKDEFGLTRVKTLMPKYGHEPYILVEQAQQCFYMTDPIDLAWSFVLKRPQREIYDIEDDMD